MRWTRPEDLKSQIQKLWNSGKLLVEVAQGGSSFPRRLSLKSPTSGELASHFDEVRVWIKELQNVSHYRIESREIMHRILGSNAIPHAIWVDNLDQALTVIQKHQEAAQFSAMLDLTRTHQPLLISWLLKNPLYALQHAPVWEHCLDLLAWIQTHPLPGIYLRQVDLPSIYSKFIENHRKLLTELFDIALQPNAILPHHKGIGQFAARYGFLEKPIRIRFRLLDSQKNLLPGGGQQDITLDALSFSRLPIIANTIFITENETNFLSFPEIPDSLVLFGSGYGWDGLAKATWLNHCKLYYWGDIDTHGFAILASLRKQFEHVQSFLMDRATLMAHHVFWGTEVTPVQYELPNLTVEENRLYDDLRKNRIRKNLRLEQEMIGYQWLTTALTSVED